MVASSFGRDSSFATNLSIHFHPATCKKDGHAVQHRKEAWMIFTSNRFNLLKPRNDEVESNEKDKRKMGGMKNHRLDVFRRNA